jgi:hypothetical protein
MLNKAGEEVDADQLSVAPLEVILVAVNPDGVGQEVGQARVENGINADHAL